MGFLEAIAEPLADLLRAIADWLDDVEDEPEPPPAAKPKWIEDGRGGWKPNV